MNVFNQNGKQPKKPVKAQSKNFETLRRAFSEGDVALVECLVNATGEKVATVCAVTRDRDEVVFTPFAVMLNGNPFEMLSPPDPSGGFRTPDKS